MADNGDDWSSDGDPNEGFTETLLEVLTEEHVVWARRGTFVSIAHATGQGGVLELDGVRYFQVKYGKYPGLEFRRCGVLIDITHYEDDTLFAALRSCRTDVHNFSYTTRADTHDHAVLKLCELFWAELEGGPATQPEVGSTGQPLTKHNVTHAIKTACDYLVSGG